MADMEIGVLIDDGINGPPEVGWLRDAVKQVLIAQGVGADAELSLVIATQERVRQLNRSYRGKDAPTDVLSFCLATPDDSSTPFVAPPDGVRHLGEVVISYPQAVIQAAEGHHSVKKEVALLIIHGVLHLLGYDHEKLEDRRRMRASEKEILSHIEGMS